MHSIYITGLTRVLKPKANKGGSTILAYFDCDTAGLALRGCAFVRTARQGLTVWPPKLDGPEDERRSVNISDERLRSVMVRGAQAAYRALGGTDGEYESTDEERSARNEAEAKERIERRRQREEAEQALPADEASGLNRFLSGAAN